MGTWRLQGPLVECEECLSGQKIAPLWTGEVFIRLSDFKADQKTEGRDFILIQILHTI